MKRKKAKMLRSLFPLLGLQFALYADAPIRENRDEEKKSSHLYEGELIVMDRLIDLHKKQVADQEQLKCLIVELKHNQELFMKGDQSKIHARLMLKAARQSLRIIEKQRLQHLFSPEFLEELAILSQVGTSLEILYE